MQIEMWKTSDLIPYLNNPRKNDKAVDAVAASIKEFGFKVPITVDCNGTIVTGHTRIKATIKLGLFEVPVIVLNDLNADQIKAFRLADNRVGEIAEWDLEALAIELGEIDLDMSQFDFTMSEASYAIEEDNFDIQIPKVSKSKYGDIYQLGNHRLMCGDATNQEDLEILMGGKVADLIILDPPYNVDYEGNAGKIINDKLGDKQFLEFLISILTNIDSVLKKGGGFYIWHAESEGLNFRTACKQVGWVVRQCLIWNKNSLVMGRQDYQWKHEPCLYGWKDGAGHYFINDRTFTTVYQQSFDIDKIKLCDAKEILKKIFNMPTTVIEEDRPNRSAEHPTMKPVRLIARLINNSSKEGSIVLDTVAGSGTTMIAAEQLKRKAYLMEIEPKFVDVIIERYEKLTNLKAKKIN